MNKVLLLEVDEHDRPTERQVTKQAAHDENLIHRCVAVYVFDSQDRLYVQVHKKSDGMLDHTVGGHVDGEETYLEAAYREMDEEIGLRDVELKEIMTSYLSYERRYTHMFGVYECSAPEGWVFKPNDEVDEIFPMSIEAIVNEMNEAPEKYTAGFMNTMKLYLEIKSIDLKIKVML